MVNALILLTDEKGNPFYLNASEIQTLRKSGTGTSVLISGRSVMVVKESMSRVIELMNEVLALPAELSNAIWTMLNKDQ